MPFVIGTVLILLSAATAVQTIRVVYGWGKHGPRRATVLFVVMWLLSLFMGIFMLYPCVVLGRC